MEVEDVGNMRMGKRKGPARVKNEETSAAPTYTGSTNMRMDRFRDASLQMHSRCHLSRRRSAALRDRRSRSFVQHIRAYMCSWRHMSRPWFWATK
jgi:hypothetical protein